MSTLRPNHLVDHSISVITSNQADTGAYLAAPGYGTYGYSWIRDGAFIAGAMTRHGQHASAGAFHQWVANTVLRYGYKVEVLEDLAKDPSVDLNEGLDDDSALHTRFTVDGGEGEAQWGNFQLDGYGFWLTSVAQHIDATGVDPEPFLPAVDLVCRYLSLTWDRPCFDCWEEYPNQRHSTTWAAIAKGLNDGGRILGNASAISVSDDIVKRLLDGRRPDGALLKFIPSDGTQPNIDDASDAHGLATAGHERVGRPLADDAIDGSSLLVLGDFGPFPSSHPVVADSLRAIEESLVVDGGVHRYLEDEYYGGGLWIVLAGALACIQESLDPQRAEATRQWIEAQADPSGNLGEQVSTHLRNPDILEPWIERWGIPASPLLWSHAMYLLADRGHG